MLRQRNGCLVKAVKPSTKDVKEPPKGSKDVKDRNLRHTAMFVLATLVLRIRESRSRKTIS